jgi:hypothetical protein
LLTQAEHAVEPQKGDALRGAERYRHGVVGIGACRDRAIDSGQEENRAADFFACGKCRAQLESRRIARQQQAALELALEEVVLSEQRLEHRADAGFHRPRQGGDIDPLDETVDDLNSDTRPFVQLLRCHDHAHQEISGAHIRLLQLGSEGEELGDGHAAADQRSGQLPPDCNEFVKLAFDIEAEKDNAQLFRALWKSGSFGGRNAGNLGPGLRQGGKLRRLDLAGRRRDPHLLRESCVDGARDNARPYERPL